MFGYLVDVSKDEITVGIKVFVLQGRFLDELVGHLASQVHEQLEHFIVASAREHDLASVQFKQGRGHRPQVNAIIVGHAEHCEREDIANPCIEFWGSGVSGWLTYFGSSIESAHQVLGDVELGRI